MSESNKIHSHNVSCIADPVQTWKKSDAIATQVEAYKSGSLGHKEVKINGFRHTVRINKMYTTLTYSVRTWVRLKSSSLHTGWRFFPEVDLCSRRSKLDCRRGKTSKRVAYEFQTYFGKRV